MERELEKARYNHLTEDISIGQVDLNAINSFVYNQGYLLIHKKDLYEYTNRVQDEIKDAYRMTLKRF